MRVTETVLVLPVFANRRDRRNPSTSSSSSRDSSRFGQNLTFSGSPHNVVRAPGHAAAHHAGR